MATEDDITTPPAKELHPETLRACAIARGEQAVPEEPLGDFTVASKDISARGSVRHWWFRMRWDGSAWQYPGSARLPNGTFRAHERRASVRAEVYLGDLLIEHNRGAQIDVGDEAAKLIVPSQDDPEMPAYVACGVKRLRSGQLRITLPDGSTVDRPDPRKRQS